MQGLHKRTVPAFPDLAACGNRHKLVNSEKGMVDKRFETLYDSQ